MAYKDKDFRDRQCIMILENDRIPERTDIDIFTRWNLDKSITFSTGRPQLNTLYIAHPARKGLYIPFEEHETALFRDKMDELILLLQSLGATEIEIERLEGMPVEDLQSVTTSFGAGASNSKFAFRGDSESSTSTRTSSSVTGSYLLKAKSSPTQPPCVPGDLQWYNITPEWEKLARQRLNGLTEYELQVSSSYSGSISESRMNSIRASLKVLLWSADADYKRTVESTHSKSKSTTWRLKIKFKPLDKYTTKDIRTKNISAPQLSPIESYRESCKSLIGDTGKITDTVKIELNRIREQLGLSANEALSIEKQFTKKKSIFWPF